MNRLSNIIEQIEANFPDHSEEALQAAAIVAREVALGSSPDQVIYSLFTGMGWERTRTITVDLCALGDGKEGSTLARMGRRHDRIRASIRSRKDRPNG